MARSEFKISVTRLSKAPGSRMDLDLEGELSEVFVTSARVAQGIKTHLWGYLESVYSGILFTGFAEVEIETECRRCLSVTKSRLKVDIQELFEQDFQSDEGDTYPIEGEFVNLAEMARDALVLGLPAAPLCKPDCKGLCQACGNDLNQRDCGHRDGGIDPRFRILDQLK